MSNTPESARIAVLESDSKRSDQPGYIFALSQDGAPYLVYSHPLDYETADELISKVVPNRFSPDDLTVIYISTD
jgi:hypothetical protein